MAALPSASSETWAPPPVSSITASAASPDRASTVCAAPSERASSSVSGSTSIATTAAPSARAIITADRPRPPQPWTATQSPARTSLSAAKAVMNRHPSDRGLDEAERVRQPDEVEVGARERDQLGERAPGGEAGLEVGVADLRPAVAARLAAARSRSRTAPSRGRRRRSRAPRGPPRPPRRPARGPARAGSEIAGSWPIQPCQSLRQTPVARTATTTPSAGGEASGTVSTAGGSPNARITAALIAPL